MIFHAYLITCVTTGKRYVGITSRSVERRWREHVHEAAREIPRMAIGRAIAEHAPHSAAAVAGGEVRCPT